MIHDLKIWPEHFGAVMSGLKTVELRRDDRGFDAGDTLVLREFEPFSRAYTGRETTREVSHVIRDVTGFGLLPGFVALSLADPDAQRRGAFIHQVAEILGVRPVFGDIEEAPTLEAARRLRAKAGEDPRLGLVLELIRSAHTTILMGSAPKAKADLGEAARLLAALMDGRG